MVWSFLADSIHGNSRQVADTAPNSSGTSGSNGQRSLDFALDEALAVVVEDHDAAHAQEDDEDVLDHSSSSGLSSSSSPTFCGGDDYDYDHHGHDSIESIIISGISKSKNKKRVQFFEGVTVNMIPGRDSLTEQDKSEMFYSSDEYRDIKQEMRDTLEYLIQQHDDEHDDGDHNVDYVVERPQQQQQPHQQYCFDGIYTPEEFYFRDEAVIQCLCAVLSEQQLQWDEDEIDPEWIAQVYVERDVHLESTLRARDRAVRIAMEVEEDQRRSEWLVPSTQKHKQDDDDEVVVDVDVDPSQEEDEEQEELHLSSSPKINHHLVPTNDYIKIEQHNDNYHHKIVYTAPKHGMLLDVHKNLNTCISPKSSSSSCRHNVSISPSQTSTTKKSLFPILPF
jgi:hypothetical protein